MAPVPGGTPGLYHRGMNFDHPDAKPPAPRKSSSADESSSSKADEEALRKFVVDVVGEKYWPVFEREEIEDLKTLRCCTARDLQDMKIPLGPRLKLLSNLEGLAA